MGKKTATMFVFIIFLMISGNVNAQTDEISVQCQPSSAATGATVTVPILIQGNSQQIETLGLTFTYDTTMFNLQGVAKGNLNQDWSTLDGWEIPEGTVTIGGFRGSGTNISIGSTGSIAIVTLTVTCGGCLNGQTSDMCIDNYGDGITGFTPEPTCDTFTFSATQGNACYCSSCTQCTNRMRDVNCDTIYLTQDISTPSREDGGGNCIGISSTNANGNILDCNGYKITGAGNFYGENSSNGIHIVGSTGAPIENVEIRNCEIEECNWGIALWDLANNIHIHDCYIHTINWAAIRINNGDDNIVENNVLVANGWNVIRLVGGSERNHIRNNNLTDTINGECIWGWSGGSRDHQIYSNRISGCRTAIRFFTTSGPGALPSNWLVYDNYITTNDIFAVSNDWYATSSWSTTQQAGTNIDGGPFICGNYLSNPTGTGYSDTCTDSDRDGLCDNPYTIYTNGTNIDYCPIAKDRSAPTTTINPDGSGGWTNSDVPFTLTCVDTISGCDKTYLNITDQGPSCGSDYNKTETGTISCAFGNVCQRMVCYYSIDKKGNTESVKVSIPFLIDKDLPYVAVTGAPGAWQNTDATASVYCDDGSGQSGCDASSYRLRIYGIDPGNCPPTYAEYTAASPQTISSHRWVCAAAKDNADNFAPSSTPVEFQVDQTPPTVAITGVESQWNSWDIVNIVCMDSGGSNCIQTKWYYFDSDGVCSTDKNDYTFSRTETWLNITETHTDYLCAWVEDNAGNYGIGVSPQLMVDTSPPTTPVVTDDGDETQSQDTLHATWSSSDPESGIAEYQYAIGIAQYPNAGWNSEVGWTSTGLNTEVTRSGLSLVAGQIYYFNVRAKNNVVNEDLWSGVGYSNGIIVNACSGKLCGEPCAGGQPGVCNGTSCYLAGGCFLDCSLPLGSEERYCYDGGTSIACSGFQGACGRSGAYKCGPDYVCNQSLISCTEGGVSTQVTGGWTSYDTPSGYYNEGERFYVNLSGIWSDPNGFTVLAECNVNRSDGSEIYFDNWGSGDVDFYYSITSTDPEGTWTVNYCDLWSDFYDNEGWLLNRDNTLHTFTVDVSPPFVSINNPDDDDVYSDNFLIIASVWDTYSPIYNVEYRWENSTSNSNWRPMSFSGGFYNATFPVSIVSDGYYNITVRARDYAGNQGYDMVYNVLIDRQPPDVTILLPETRWYNSDFDVQATATDNQDVTSVSYRWENSTNIGIPQPMAEIPPNSDNYIATFDVSSVAPGNYTINVSAQDAIGGEGFDTVDVGIDHVKPSSSMSSPSPGEIIMTTLFDIGWTGSDVHSGIDCYYVEYTYQDSGGVWAPRSWNMSFGCTPSTADVFNAVDETGVDERYLNNYTFHFRSVALDNAGNKEVKSGWETNVTIYIPQIVTVSVRENETGRDISYYRGRVANNRTVIINVRAKESISENLNITIYYSNHTFGQEPSNWRSRRCTNVRECNLSVRILTTYTNDIMEVDYYIVAINSSDPNVRETLPPGAPNNYFYYYVYYHPLCNFAVKGYPKILQITFGSSELVPVEVRNIHNQNDKVKLKLTGPAMFLENKSSEFEVPMSQNEEKIIISNLIPPSEKFPVAIICNSTVDSSLWDNDTITILIGMPADFSGLSEFGIFILILLAGLIYVRLVSDRKV